MPAARHVTRLARKLRPSHRTHPFSTLFPLFATTMQALAVRTSAMRPSLALQRRPSFRATCMATRRALPVVRASGDRQQETEEEQTTVAATTLLAAAGLLAPFLLDIESAQAVPEILKGRTASLIHPGECCEQPGSRCGEESAPPSAGAAWGSARLSSAAHWSACLLPPAKCGFIHPLLMHHTFSPAAVMFFLFGGSVWAGWLGLQWRRTR